jgi:hypothetical protein
MHALVFVLTYDVSVWADWKGHRHITLLYTCMLHVVHGYIMYDVVYTSGSSSHTGMYDVHLTRRLGWAGYYGTHVLKNPSEQSCFALPSVKVRVLLSM